jgi:hypothetical protein
LTFRHKLGLWQNFAMTFPETLHRKSAINEHSFTPVTHMAYFDTRYYRYGFLKTKQGAELLWTAWTLEQNSSFRGPKMSESERGLITDSVAYLPSSSTPTQTHDFGNHSNGYGRSKTALVRS